MPPKCSTCGYYHGQHNPCPPDPAQSAPSAEPRFVDGKCRYCNEPQDQHGPNYCGYDKCKGQECDKWIIRPQNQYQLCDECLLARTAQLERERDALKEEIVPLIIEVNGAKKSLPIWAGMLSRELERAKAAETRAETAESALAEAVKFEVGTIQGQPVYVELSARDWHFATGSGKVEHPGVSLWSVRLVGNCLTKSGDWIYEPLSSARDEQFISDARWDSYAVAKEAAKNALTVAAQTPEEKS